MRKLEVDLGQELVLFERHGAVAVIRLNAPPLNLLTQDLRRDIGDVFEGLSARNDVRAVVLHGGTTFCAGADLKEFQARFDPAIARNHCRNGHRAVSCIAKCPHPTISAIEGPCLGGGFELALACDFRIAGADSKLGLPETGRGVWPGMGGMFFLEKLVNRPTAKRIVLTGEILKAFDACNQSLIDECTDTGASYGRAMNIAEVFAGRSSASLASVKRLMDSEMLTRLDSYLQMEESEYIKTYQTHDAQEGVRSFLEKRPPEWLHR